MAGILNSTPNNIFTIEVFVNDSCDPSGFGEGQTPIGTVMVSTDGDGFGSFGPTALATASPRLFATATATDSGNNTSEFSQCFSVAGDIPTPTVTPTRTTTATLTRTPTVSPTGTVPTSTATSTRTPTLLGEGGPGAPEIPALSPALLGLLGLALAAAGYSLLRRR